MYEHRIAARFVNGIRPDLTCAAGYIGAGTTKESAEEDARRQAFRKLENLKSVHGTEDLRIEWILKKADCQDAQEHEAIQGDWADASS